MKFAVVLCVLILWLASVYSDSTCRVPDVYEFCSALNANDRTKDQIQNHQIQQRIPGKRGSIGMRGPQGEKGEQGEQGTCQHLEERIRSLEVELREKFELIPKLVYCGTGMKNGEIHDSKITASSQQDHRFSPSNARLDGRITNTVPSSSNVDSIGAWCPSSNDGQWIQVDLETPKSVSGIITQGNPPNPWGYQCFVKTYKIACGNTVEGMQIISEKGDEKIFVGNIDTVTKVINKFSEPVTCRYVRLYVISWNTKSTWNRPCLRMEILKGECHDLF